MANVYYLDKLYNIAKLHGDKTVNFKVNDAIDNYDAVNLETLNKKLKNVGGSGSSGGVSNCNECSDTFAKLHGDSSNTFKVNDAIDNYDAVNLETLNKKLKNVGGSGSSGGGSGSSSGVNCSDCANTFAALHGSTDNTFSVAKPTKDSHAASKKYVDSKLDKLKNFGDYINTIDNNNYYITVSNTGTYKLDKLSVPIRHDGFYLVTYTISAKVIVNATDPKSGDYITNSFRAYRSTGSSKLNDLVFSHMGAFYKKVSSGVRRYDYSASMTFVENFSANDNLYINLRYKTTNNSNISTTFYYGRPKVNSSIVAVRLGSKY